MKIEILNITPPLSAEAVERASESLKTIPGVHHVSFFDSPASLHARIDDGAPTRVELVAALNKAGVLVEEERRPHASGSCCGGCGS